MIVLPGLLLFLLILGFLALLIVVARKRPPFADDGRTLTLRHSAFLRWFSIAALFGGETLFALWVSILPPLNDEIALLIAGGAIALGVLGLALLWESYCWRMTLSPAGLDCRSPWKSRQTVPREEVASVSYSNFNGWYVLRFKNGCSFRVPAIVPGMPRLLNALGKKV